MIGDIRLDLLSFFLDHYISIDSVARGGRG